MATIEEGRNWGWGVYLTTHSTHLVTVTWRRNTVKGHSHSESKPAAATWATLSD